MKAEDFGLPVDEPVDIGYGGTITLHEHDGEVVGLTEAHTHNGHPCCGFVRFVDAVGGYKPGSREWTVQQAKPLTISPSVLCTTCGRHGFIREGKWVPA